MAEDPIGERKNIPQAAYFLFPLLIVGFLLVGAGLYQGREVSVSARSTTTSAVSTARGTPAPAMVDVPGDGLGIISGPATPWAVAGGPGEPTSAPPTVAPPVSPMITLSILGPPAGSVFQIDDVVNFYWSSPEPLSFGRRFVIYLLSGDERLALGAVDEANLGLGYQLQAIPGRSAGQAGTYGWVVVLEDGAVGSVLGQSEIRPIMILGSN